MTAPANDTFNYLAVLFSIIVGLAVTDILQGARDLLVARARVRFFWPSALRALTLLLVLAQTWWSIFGLRRHDDWTFGMYGSVLTQITLLYLVSALALPRCDGEAPIDMRAAYYRQARPFYGLLLAAAVASIAKDVVLDGHLSRPVNLVFHAIFMGIALLAAWSRRDRVQQATMLTLFLAFVGYIVALFDKLPS